ncbi:hypothetical protein AJ78_05074 [Emergomyces pasteurianus Ep9510]|uniref:Integral membrane protein n=1 Tax=Emergomyces pasteurianus Ep9510 TaxID=1447872 RepID=A0A1J9Q308_9EURO|nr:hypothetical protein AJ78_05074 [Emergomyces pasteurianus Ep9510]
MLISRPAVRVILLTLFVLSLFIYYGKTHFYRDPGSIFYDPGRAFERTYSLHRESEAKEYIRTVAGRNETGSTFKAGEKPVICGVFSTVKRKGVQYVETAIASMVYGLTPAERADLHLGVLFAHANTTAHPSLKLEWLHRAVDFTFTYKDNMPEETFLKLQTLEETANFQEKGVFDYTYALKQCYAKKTPYIAMFEDDTLFADGWLVRSLIALREIESAAADVMKPWLYMRLFNQERSTGWAHRNIGGNNEPWIILGIAAAILAPAFLVRRWLQLRRSSSSSSRDCAAYLGAIYAIVLFTVPCFVILFFQAGKASMLPPSPGVFRELFGCCSQAMIFPSERVPGLIEFLERKERGQVDLLLKDLAIAEGFDTYALYPVQVQHIGSSSVRGTSRQEAQAVWSMAFENLNADSLHKEHLEMVSQYYKK